MTFTVMTVSYVYPVGGHAPSALDWAVNYQLDPHILHAAPLHVRRLPAWPPATYYVSCTTLRSPLLVQLYEVANEPSLPDA